MTEDKREALWKAEALAIEHVDWLLVMLRPLLLTHFVHGYKHGQEDAQKTPKEDADDT